jgi:hypothetical protein
MKKTDQGKEMPINSREEGGEKGEEGIARFFQLSLV